MKFERVTDRFPGLCVAEGVVSVPDVREISGELEAFKPGSLRQDTIDAHHREREGRPWIPGLP